MYVSYCVCMYITICIFVFYYILYGIMYVIYCIYSMYRHGSSPYSRIYPPARRAIVCSVTTLHYPPER